MSSAVFSAASSEEITVEAIIAAAASSVSVSLAAPQLFVAAMAAGAGAATGGLAAVVGYASFLAIRQLHIDYQQAVQEFHTRSAEQAAQAAEFQAKSAQSIAGAETINNYLAETINKYSTMDYLSDNITRLQEQIRSLPLPVPQLETECAILVVNFSAEGASVSKILEDYFRLVGKYRQASLKSEEKSVKQLLTVEIDYLREVLNGPLYDAADEERTSILQQLAILQPLITKQARFAEQGIKNLRVRVESSIKQKAIRETGQEQLREELAASIARLQAVSNQQIISEVRSEAVALLEDITVNLAIEGQSAQPVAELIASAAEIFQRCEKMLAEETIARYLREQVTEVLLSMGYQVTPAEGKYRPLLASLGKDIGLEVQFGEGGALQTQMVALSENAVLHGAEEQERVCKLVDQLFAALKSRDCKIQERFRLSLGKDEQLRVITLPASAEQPAQQPVAKQMIKD